MVAPPFHFPQHILPADIFEVIHMIDFASDIRTIECISV